MVAVNLQTVNGHHSTAAMFLLLTVVFSIASAATTLQPNIVVIVADDLGFNDVSFRGSRDIPTPNIDALAYTGRILDRHYVLPTCTPSRTALLTGKYPVQTGMQGFPLKAGEARALPIELTLLPQYLKRLNYTTHLIGKWHQGSHKWMYTPPHRGFDSFFGYYHGYIGYYNHAITMSGYKPKTLRESPANGIDLHRNDTIALDVRGTYATELFTRETERIIRNHDKETPLFIDLSHLAVHTGKDGVEVEVEDEVDNDKEFEYIQDLKRRRYAGAMKSLDKSVGRLVKALVENDMLQNTIILFMADNGGETTGIHANAASNYPLRGQKFTQFEGGVRGAAVLWHAGLKPTDKLYSDYVHVADWLPSFYEAAGGDLSDLDDIDGVSQWGRLTGQNNKVPRTEFLVNSEYRNDEPVSARSYVDGPWKLVWGLIFPTLSNYSGDPGVSDLAEPYDLKKVVNSETMNYLLSASQFGTEGLMKRAEQLRNLATLPENCREGAPEQVPTCNGGCLFNVIDDPCEVRDVSAEYPDIVAALKAKLKSWQEKTVPQLNREVDPASDPRNYDGTWVPWGDVLPYGTHCKRQDEAEEGGSRSTPVDSSYPLKMLSIFVKTWNKIVN